MNRIILPILNFEKQSSFVEVQSGVISNAIEMATLFPVREIVIGGCNILVEGRHRPPQLSVIYFAVQL